MLWFRPTVGGSFFVKKVGQFSVKNNNIEMMWLTQGLTPSYKTIANFRKNNPKALQTIFKEFSILIKDLKLITGDLVAVDGA